MKTMKTTKITTSRKLTCRDVAALRNQYGVAMRDVATSLLGDPFEADRLVTRVFRSLHGREASLVGTGEAAERWLIEYVTDRCIARYAAMVRRQARAAAELAQEVAA